MDTVGIYVVIRHLNVHREQHRAGSLVWSHECSRRAQDLVNREIAYPGSVISGMMSNNGATCLGQNLAVRVEGISPAAACIRAIDMWQVSSKKKRRLISFSHVSALRCLMFCKITNRTQKMYVCRRLAYLVHMSVLPGLAGVTPWCRSYSSSRTSLCIWGGTIVQLLLCLPLAAVDISSVVCTNAFHGCCATFIFLGDGGTFLVCMIVY